MIRKRLLSACLALALCLSLLPVTALAAAPSGQELYVGNVKITSTGYWTTDDDGNVTAYSGAGTPSDNYIYYDESTNTLTLHNATIKESVSTETNSFIAGAAIGVHNQNGAAELTITLEGTNTIAEVGKGIYVLANSTGGATLTITGDGSLNASASQTGIWVQSNSNNAALCVENAEVTASVDGAFNDGVLVQAKDGSDVSLTVNGGSLTASVNANIWFQFGSGTSGSGTPTVTVSNNAIVRANGGIANNSSSPIQYETGSDSTGGIVFDGNTGTVYGKVELQEDLEIGEGESLTIPEGSSLDMGGNEITVASGGKLEGTPTGSGTVKIAPTITTESLPDGEVGTAYSQTLVATGDTPITWTVSGTLPAGLSLDAATGIISGTPTAQGTSNFTVTATNDYGSDSKEFTLTIDQQGTIHVTSVSLDKANLELTEGETAQLTATVAPEGATNKNVTWSTSNASIATVDANGEVTAVSAGTATITVTTADGGKTDTCTVTVREEAPDRPVSLPDTHSIDLIVSDGGEAKLSLTNASEGSTITVTATPDEGFKLDYITVDGERIDGTTFTMPDHDVTVRVYFTDGAALPFADVSAGAWYFDAVSYVYVGGLMDGVSDTLFDPDGTMTRAMVWAILARVDGETVTGEDWIETAREWAVAEGVTDGENATDYVTREQLATMLWRYASGKGYDVSVGEDTNILSYADFADLSEYAIPAMQWACGAGVITGVTDATLVPQGEATRAQVAAMLMRFVEAIG